VFGFASIKPILVADGVYHDYCRPLQGSWAIEYDSHQVCPEQEIRLNLLFIIASVTTNASSLLAGYVLDRYGRRICATLAACFLATGALLFASRIRAHGLDGYLLGNVFLSLGGTCLFLPSFQLSNAFPKQSGIIVAMVTCAFDASSAILFLYSLVWSATDGRASLSKFFLGYLSVPAAIILAEWTIMPENRYHTMLELEGKIAKAQDPLGDIHASDEEISNDETLFRVRSNRATHRQDKIKKIERLTGNAEEREERALQRTIQQDGDTAWGMLHGRTVRQQMKTPWFILLLLVTAFQMLRMNFFIATISSQYQNMLESDDAADIVTRFFNAALPIGGVAATPFIAIILNKLSTSSVIILLAAYIAMFSVLNCLAHTWAGIATVAVFVTFRPFYYSAVSYVSPLLVTGSQVSLTVISRHTASQIFGFATFGRVYGTIICASGLLNLIQPVIDSILTGPLAGNPLSINIFLGVMGTVLAVIFAAYSKIEDIRRQRSLRL
jgi:hypothetical protein